MQEKPKPADAPPIEVDISKPPICPHCTGELAGCAVYMWQVEGGVITAIYCPHCRKALHFQYFPLAVARQEQPRIARPS